MSFEIAQDRCLFITSNHRTSIYAFECTLHVITFLIQDSYHCLSIDNFHCISSLIIPQWLLLRSFYRSTILVIPLGALVLSFLSHSHFNEHTRILQRMYRQIKNVTTELKECLSSILTSSNCIVRLENQGIRSGVKVTIVCFRRLCKSLSVFMFSSGIVRILLSQMYFKGAEAFSIILTYAYTYIAVSKYIVY